MGKTTTRHKKHAKFLEHTELRWVSLGVHRSAYVINIVADALATTTKTNQVRLWCRMNHVVHYISMG